MGKVEERRRLAESLFERLMTPSRVLPLSTAQMSWAAVFSQMVCDTAREEVGQILIEVRSKAVK